MHRRRFLANGLTLLCTRFPLGNEALAAGLTRLGAAQPFDYARLKQQARTLAGQAYRAPRSALPAHVAGLDWDRWQSIVFRKTQSLWADDDRLFQARFFHLGFTMMKPVRLYAVQNGTSREIAYDPAMFDYGRSGLAPGDAPPDLGFAGFNLFYHTDWNRDRAAFQGASYFRAVDGDKQYGMSRSTDRR